MRQGPRDPVWPCVADVAQQDRQLQRVLAGRVPQPPQDLAGRRARRRVDRWADQDQAADPVGTAEGQVDGDLAAERVAENRHGSKSDRVQPGGEVLGMLGDVQDPARVAAVPEAGKIDHVDWVVAGKSGRQGHQVAVGDREPVHEYHRKGTRGWRGRSGGGW